MFGRGGATGKKPKETRGRPYLQPSVVGVSGLSSARDGYQVRAPAQRTAALGARRGEKRGQRHRRPARGDAAAVVARPRSGAREEGHRRHRVPLFGRARLLFCAARRRAVARRARGRGTRDDVATTPRRNFSPRVCSISLSQTIVCEGLYDADGEFLELPEGTRVLHGFLYSLRNKKERKYDLLNIAFVSVEAT